MGGGYHDAMLRAIIFDFDGVIADTEPLHFRAFAQALDGRGVMPSEEEYFADYVGLNDETFIRQVHAGAGRKLDPDELKTLRSVKDRAYMSMIAGGLALLPGVEDFINRVCRRWKLAVCSGARRVEIELVLARAGLAEHFVTIVSADEAPISKPDPAGFLVAVDELSKHLAGLRPCECLAIEDSRNGIRAARSAGLRVLAVGALAESAQDQTDAFAPSLVDVTYTDLTALFR